MPHAGRSQHADAQASAYRGVGGVMQTSKSCRWCVPSRGPPSRTTIALWRKLKRVPRTPMAVERASEVLSPRWAQPASGRRAQWLAWRGMVPQLPLSLHPELGDTRRKDPELFEPIFLLVKLFWEEEEVGQRGPAKAVWWGWPGLASPPRRIQRPQGMEVLEPLEGPRKQVLVVQDGGAPGARL